MNVPKLRFSEFNDNYILDTYDNVINIIDGDRGNNYPKESDFYDDEYCLFLNAGNVTKNGFNFSNKSFITLKKDNELRNGKLRRNDVVLTTRGTVGNVALYDDSVSFENIRINSGMVINRIKSNKLLPQYLYQFMQSSIFDFQVKKTNFGSAQPQLTKKGIAKFNITYPSIKEQRKVCNFLSLLDKKIELQSMKIEALKLFKKGLFDIQLKINGKESIMFDDFLDEVTKKSSIQNQYPVLSSTSKGLFLQSDYFNKQASCENNVGYKILKRNQLVLSPQNLWMGNININNIFDIGIVSPSYRVYNIDIKKMDLNYFNYWIKTPKALYSYLISSEQGASIVRRNLNIEMFNQISLKIPNLEKQHIIGNRIYQFDLKINLEEEKLKLLYKLKKGLMQKMFI